MANDTAPTIASTADVALDSLTEGFWGWLKRWLGNDSKVALEAAELWQQSFIELKTRVDALADDRQDPDALSQARIYNQFGRNVANAYSTEHRDAIVNATAHLWRASGDGVAAMHWVAEIASIPPMVLKAVMQIGPTGELYFAKGSVWFRPVLGAAALQLNGWDASMWQSYMATQVTSRSGGQLGLEGRRPDAEYFFRNDRKLEEIGISVCYLLTPLGRSLYEHLVPPVPDPASEEAG